MISGWSGDGWIDMDLSSVWFVVSLHPIPKRPFEGRFLSKSSLPLFYSFSSSTISSCVACVFRETRQILIYRRHDDHFHSQRSPLIIHTIIRWRRRRRADDWDRLQDRYLFRLLPSLGDEMKRTNGRLLLPPAKEVSEHFVPLNGPNKLPSSSHLPLGLKSQLNESKYSWYTTQNLREKRYPNRE